MAIVETPGGSRNKYNWEPGERAFRLGKVLPEGFVFPHDFGFFPNTEADDGDPVDVLILGDEPTFPGCRVEVRLIGVIEGEQLKKGKRERNHRLIAVAEESRRYARVISLSDLGSNVIEELEHFFVMYHLNDGTTYRVVGRKGSASATRALDEARRQ